MTTDDQKHICHGCIGEEYLASRVRDGGTKVLCSYCGEERNGLTLVELANRLHEALQQHFYATPDHPSEPYEFFLASEGKWEQRGDPAEYLIGDMAGLADEIAADVTAVLSELHSYRARKQTGEDPYSPEILYEAKGANEGEFRFAWIEFVGEIRSRARFFSATAKGHLDRIFGDLAALRTYSYQSVVCEIGPGTAHSSIWRARQAESTSKLERIMKSLPREIGPPPSKSATGGRMNAQGISVFYGALDPDTCVAEVRPLVGSKVVVAEFELLRALQLLDFDTLAELHDGGSYFDADFADRRGRAAFFKWLVGEIGGPVMSQDESFEHIATQAMAEYLSNIENPQLDGIIFRSAQTGGVGRNVVLFQHACGIESSDLPPEDGVEVSIGRPGLLGEDDNGGDDEEVRIVETVESKPNEEGSGDRMHRPIMVDFDYEPPPYDELTLKLVFRNVTVLDVQGIGYDSKPLAIHRHQLPKPNS